MKNLHTEEQIKDMRRRLYNRGSKISKIVRHDLTDIKVNVSRNWGSVSVEKERVENVESNAQVDTLKSDPRKQTVPSEFNVKEKPKRRYRSFVLIGSFLMFVFVAIVSSAFMYFGGNKISSQNIHVSLQGKSLIGGGEIMELTISVDNQNTVPIESGTLILKYPEGTRSTGDSSHNVFEERIPLDKIDPGSVQNINVKVLVYGEVDVRKEIEAMIEFSVDGSDSVFTKKADSLAFRISSSPLILIADFESKVASGQRMDIVLTVSSNSSSLLNDILVTASYPNGFIYRSADIEPIYGQNVWKIDELLPEESFVITIKGKAQGFTDDEYRINFNAGPFNVEDEYSLKSILAKTQADFLIERPFIDVQVNINGDKNDVVILAQEETASINLNITNTLDETVYDMVVEVIPRGSAVSTELIDSTSGFYDSNTGSVRWEVSNNESFQQVLPGSTRGIEYTINQNENHTESSFDMEINVYARRVAESSAQEVLIGSAVAEAKYSSFITTSGQVGRNISRFVDVGPVPPEVGKFTSYTITLVAETDANDVSGMILKTSLPIHVKWLDEYDVDGTIIYNDVSKQILWDIGDVPLGERREFSFQVGLKPSLSQVEKIPILVNSQSLKGNDAFTSALLEDDSESISTNLSLEMGYKNYNGVVIR